MNKKILTIHSEDRDINKWPYPNEFELYLPDNYTNIESINLTNISITNNFYNISEELFNNYLIIDGDYKKKTIIIPNGYYTANDLAFVLTSLFKDQSFSIEVLYDKIKNKFLFISNNKFSLFFDMSIATDNEKILCYNKNKFRYPEKIANQYSHWGIGYNLGFDKIIYDSSKNNIIHDGEVIYYNVNRFDICLNNFQNINTINLNDISSLQYIYSEFQVDLNPLNTIYMEVDKYNYCDEITPYQYRSNYTYCNDYNSNINSYFAKIQFLIQNSTIGKQMTSTKNEGYISYGHLICKNPIEKLRKLKFKFRYHNDSLVNFNQINFNFTLEFNLKCMP
jgi:hypothetical protein